MKCLSLWQPWATLLVSGHKLVETRSWPIKYRGPLLIHAAKKWTEDLANLCESEPFAAALSALEVSGSKLPFGAVVGRVDVVGCYSTEAVKDTTADVRMLGSVLEITATERAFGDYSSGRFAFLCRNPVMFKAPILYRGSQGLFDVPDGLIRDAA